MSTGYSSSHLSLHVGSSFMIRCSTYPDQTPILSIDAGGTCLSITPTGRNADDDALRFARELLHQVETFATEIERMHAARDSDTTADGDAVTGDKAASTQAA